MKIFKTVLFKNVLAFESSVGIICHIRFADIQFYQQRLVYAQWDKRHGLQLRSPAPEVQSVL